MTTYKVTPLQEHTLNDAVAVTSRAFWPDPLFGFFARSSVHEHRNMPKYVRAVISDAMRYGEVDAAVQNDRVVATASWLPVGASPRSQWREFRIAAQCVSALLAGRNRVTAMRLLREMDKRHPKEPHLYLALIGVDPASQGKGIGNTLIRPRLDECDATGIPVYLETQKPENLAYYERFGFTVRDAIIYKGCPTLWSMWREPSDG
jgi:GNAT superfamily N-acetyltransferase